MLSDFGFGITLLLLKLAKLILLPVIFCHLVEYAPHDVDRRIR